ncbi:DIS3-like exonuclease 1 isoform X2 [Clytia hemisphaerica]|uniref:DIS3-like exonuclease 1 isoform X2 n=1 Tax=Clytia hemisphaerica TaxID=252671 RepID=UPI0034D7AE03
MSIIILTECEEVLKNYGSETPGIFVMSMTDYINGFWPDLNEAKDLMESLSSINDVEELNIGASICKEFHEYFPNQVLEAGIKSGRFFANYLKVNKHRPMMEAFIQKGDGKISSSSTSTNNISQVLIHGTAARNRAVDGDSVVVELLPESQWKSRSTSIHQHSESNSSSTNQHNDSDDKMATGRVVGVLQRNLRDYVVSIPEEEINSRSSKVLVVPWDRKIPKIRITTRQKDRLTTERFVVRIDSWDVGSLYPNGHFVKSLGPAGNVETEIASILMEHGLSVIPFSEGILKEMPVNTKVNEWKMCDGEIQRRKDLRESHLIFSIDPKGCEDVDDTLSVRKLANGNWELGVHIADVTYFVQPNSLTDLQARSKTTTVYLADRRYDMLPAILSSDLCSLISEQDRYAVSVIWELNPIGDVINVWYGRTIICSKYKLFYEAAQQIATGEMDFKEALENVPELQKVQDEKKCRQQFEEMKQAIQHLMLMARQIKFKRSQLGAIDLQSSEVQLEMNEAKDIKGLAAKQPLEVHETIAECMIFANHWVAKKIKESFPSKSILRRHPPPNQEFFSTLKECAQAKGFTVNTCTNHLLADSLNRCTDEDSNTNKIFRMLGTQAMMVASYFSTGSLKEELFSHYGLALDSYTHFTSPIRRYADVLVHRLLLASIGDELTNQSELLNNKDLQELCEHINVKHREADQAQKESLDFFQAMYFKEHSEDDEICVVDALVYQFKSNGVLVFIPKFGIKGAVPLRDNEGNIACHCGDKIKYVSGSMITEGAEIVLKYSNGKKDHIVNIFTYIKVRIKVISSTMHADRLQFEMTSFHSNITMTTNEHTNGGKLNVTKSDLIKDVKNTESEMLNRKEENEKEVSKREKSSLKKKYGQTHSSVSMYEMFRSFKMDSLTVDRGKATHK